MKMPNKIADSADKWLVFDMMILFFLELVTSVIL
jgi:hypothetical protein